MKDLSTVGFLIHGLHAQEFLLIQGCCTMYDYAIAAHYYAHVAYYYTQFAYAQYGCYSVYYLYSKNHVFDNPVYLIIPCKKKHCKDQLRVFKGL